MTYYIYIYIYLDLETKIEVEFVDYKMFCYPRSYTCNTLIALCACVQVELSNWFRVKVGQEQLFYTQCGSAHDLELFITVSMEVVGLHPLHYHVNVPRGVGSMNTCDSIVSHLCFDRCLDQVFQVIQQVTIVAQPQIVTYILISKFSTVQ